jgi:hypothetical protein
VSAFALAEQNAHMETQLQEHKQAMREHQRYAKAALAEL